MIASYNKTQEERDDAIRKGYIFGVESDYIFYYLDNRIEADYIAKTEGKEVQIYEKEIIKCSGCGQYLASDGIWEPYHDLAIIECNLEDGIVGNISHTICPECQAKYNAELEDLQIEEQPKKKKEGIIECIKCHRYKKLDGKWKRDFNLLTSKIKVEKGICPACVDDNLDGRL